MTGFIIFMVVVTIIAVIFLKGFDGVSGQGPNQVKDGINRSKLGEGAKEDSTARVPCPECAELIIPGAKKCRFCQSILVKEVK